MADLNGDRFTLLDSNSTNNVQPCFNSKQWSYQTDQNNGSYGAKQVIFDLAGFYNNQRWINPKEMFIVLPVLSTLTSISSTNDPALAGSGLGAPPMLARTAAGQPPVTNPDPTLMFSDNGAEITNQYSMGFKSGFWHLIRSIQITVDGKDVIQLVPDIGFHASFVANTTWSESDLKKHGALTGYYPDSATSWKIPAPAATTNYGHGVCNNEIPPKQKFYPYPQMETQRLVSAAPNDVRNPSNSRQVFHGSSNFLGTKEIEINEGLWERMKTTNFMNKLSHVTGLTEEIANGTYPQTSISLGDLLSDSEAGTFYENHVRCENQTLITNGVVVNTGDDAKSSTAYRQMHTTAIIRFKDICDLFSNLPLTRGLYMRIQIFVNTGNLVVGASGTMASSSVVDAALDTLIDSKQNPHYSGIRSNSFPGTCPIMLTPIQVSGLSRHSKPAAAANTALPDQHYPGGGFNGTFPVDSNLLLYPGVAADLGTSTRKGLCLSVSIASADPIHKEYGFGSALPSHTLMNCRIYAPIIDLEPSVTKDYILTKNKAIYYRDVLRFPNMQVPTNLAFNFNIANGLVNAKRLIIIPFYHDSNIESNTHTDGYSDFEYMPFEPTSPFDSAPATTAPRAYLTDFNVLISNMNIFQQNINYSFENFIQEMSPVNSINGGLGIGCTSGLIDYNMWVNNYRYYVVDLSRRLAGDNTPKSLSIVGKNSSKYTVDYYCFVEYERHLDLDVETGHISVSNN